MAVDPSNHDPANQSSPGDEGTREPVPVPKRRASDLMGAPEELRLGEFGNLDITGVGAVSQAARAVREALGEDPAGSRSSGSYPVAPPQQESPASVQPRQPDPEPEPIQPSSRLGDISSQFGKLIIDGLHAVSGAFRHSKAQPLPGNQPDNSAPVAENQSYTVSSPDIERGSGSLSDRFTRAIMDKFRSIVDSRWQEQFRVDREALIKVIERVPNPIVREEIERNMAAFEQRAHSQKMEISQVKNTYRSVLFLIENLRRQSSLDDTERLLLAMQVVRLAAHPGQATAGRFPTGDVVPVEKMIYHDCPSAAAHLIAEIALYNTFMTQRGLDITLPGDDLHPDDEARDPVGNSGNNRSYASQLFHQVTLNIYYARHGVSGMQARYRINPDNNSEELVTVDGHRLALDSSARSINVDELRIEIAGEPSSR